MNLLRKSIASAVVALVLTTAASGAAQAAPRPSSPQMAHRDASDAVLAAEFLRINQAGDGVALRRLLSPDFLLQRSDGTYLTREQYLLRPSKIDAFQISDVVGTRTRGVRVIRYTLAATIEIDGRPISQEPVPRLSAFVWRGGAWRLVAHANFAAIPKS
ncbi:nuclear transport factor 2 family protein [Capillimicrobium parvum]|uniref:DUF4440 domain-containing protein n=1 Tax=Capillimicrobium parvum TaxID=2884022 RepID=A0A9E6XXT6_9ACTN|nr:nuclear transport factor 2 family protein [Capillimicrobium parvum]UGS36482.1 hypothetical protein DSM104329_02888 [Capillimicrobium parvum]